MIEVLIRVRDRSTHVTIYNIWDVDSSQVAGWDCTKDDIGKFIEFDDGSRLFTRIKNCNSMAVRTEIGTYRRKDIVHCSIPKWPAANYSGIEPGRESFLVRPSTHREKRNASRIVNDTLPTGFTVSEREKKLAIDKLREEISIHGINEKWIIDKLKKMAANVNNRHAMESIKVLARVAGIELNQPRVLGDGGGMVALFQQVNQGTIQQQRRQEIPNLRTLRKAIKIAKDTAVEAEVEIVAR